MRILNWETDYAACDDLQMGCAVGERWALNQMQNADSQLSKQGRDICRKIEEMTNIPTFYYLYNYRRVRGDESLKPCPVCNKDWYLKKKIHDYDFKCDDCRIISNRSLNS